MNPLAVLFFLSCAVALLVVPRKWAPAPLLLGCTYMTLGQGIELGPVSLPVYRMMLLVGLVRVVIKGEGVPGGFNVIDKLMVTWGVWVVFASFFHDPERAGPIYACGVVFNLTLIYFLIRIWCTALDEVQEVIVFVALLLVPIAIEMVTERITGKNLFSVFGGVPENVVVREGEYRAQGPFRHPILAGTVGATCVPLFVGILKKYKTLAIIGIGAGVIMTFASASSGPVMSLIFGGLAILLWRFKQFMSPLRYAVAAAYLILMVTMAKPPYYLIARIDVSGGSTGWHRAFLIENTFKHFSEWWLFGTDITRHWMPLQGIGHDPLHTDITNYYIGFGVTGGLLAMLLVIAMMLVSFAWVGKIHDSRSDSQAEQRFMIWCFGASLFSHAATSISVAYFDQSMLFFWLNVAVISSFYMISRQEASVSTGDLIEVPDSLDGSPEAVALRNAEWRRRLRERIALDGGSLIGGPK